MVEGTPGLVQIVIVLEMTSIEQDSVFWLKEKVSTFLFDYRYRSELLKVFMSRIFKTDIGP